MAVQNSAAVVPEPTRSIPVPSTLWCHWQGIKGLNFRHLEAPNADLQHQWVLITGGNSGVGREAAIQFAKWGANVVLGCRQPPPHEPHPDAVVQELRAAARDAGYQDSKYEWWEVDMANLASVEALGNRWLDTKRPLDVLANNAGIAHLPGKAQYTKDGFEIIHQVNFLAHVLLTMILLPSLKKAPAPRIICTTSCMQYSGIFDLNNANSGIQSYPNNKLYFQTWLTELQNRISQHDQYKHITICGVHPGFVQTNIWHWLQPATPEAKAKMPWVGFVLLNLLTYVGIDAQQGSLAITHAAVMTTTEQTVGTYFNRIWQEEPMPQTKDPECRRLIWDFVDKELKLKVRGLLNDLGV